MVESPVLVVGASGFVGRHVCVALAATGHEVRRATSQRNRVTETEGGAWVHLDVNDVKTFARALEGCRKVIYLYHGLGSGNDYPMREANAAIGFRNAAIGAGIERLVYLGGVVPTGLRSQHLDSRRATGEIFRDGPLLALELRAAMIIGKGSVSFNLMRDLAARAPVLALPPWLDQGSWPIAIDDVVYALVRALDVSLQTSAWFELPGPEWVTHRDLITRLAAILGTRVFSRRFSWLSPALTSRLLGVIGREPYPVVAELVAGLPCDLTPSGTSFWTGLGETARRPLVAAMLDALADETSTREPSLATEERLIQRLGKPLGATT